jgi:hypothetical protein
MANYASDLDLVKIRPNILNLGVKNWDDQHAEATRQINRVLEKRWYYERAADHGIDPTTTPFDQTKVDGEQVKNLACYKALELVYLYLMKDAPSPDGFEREYKIFRDLYKEELSDLVTIGINYDWDEDDLFTGAERLQPRIRRLQRT